MSSETDRRLRGVNAALEIIKSLEWLDRTERQRLILALCKIRDGLILEAVAGA